MEDSNADTSSSDRPAWGWFAALGVVMIIAGVAALFVPFATSLAVELIVGAAFLASGIVSLFQIFTTDDGWSARGMYLLLGLFNTFAGALLLLHPFEGLLALTMLMIIAMLVNGILRFVVGLQSRPEDGWGWVTFSGVLSVLISIFFFSQYPEISTVLLGIFVGVSLVGDGAGFLRFAFALKTE